MKKNIKWGTIIPLIGGSIIGSSIALESKPEWMISYKEFNNNESHLKEYWKDVDHFYVGDQNVLSEVDFVTAVCPCAGLSSANSSNRGHDAPQNDWMYKSAEYVLENIKPKVFMGENAPGLFTNVGMQVGSNLYDIATKYGYSFSLIKTDTQLHGIPQKRIRTFYFFWKSNTAPLMNWYNNETELIETYLKNIPESSTYQDIFINKEPLIEHTFYKWYKKNNITPQDMLNSKTKTIMQYVIKHDMLDNLIEYCDSINDEFNKNKVIKIREKLNAGLNYWDDTPTIINGHINTITSRSMKMCFLPQEERFLNLREYMHLMGLPHNMNLIEPNKNHSHITQNVPTCTSRDMTNEVIKFINNKLPLSGATYLKQDNIKKENIKIIYKNNKLF
jgi:site-specific DNA-cytosine methylase